jgi:uncharacterized membrane protein
MALSLFVVFGAIILFVAILVVVIAFIANRDKDN